MTFKFYYYFQTQKMKVIKKSIQNNYFPIINQIHYDELKRLHNTM